MRTARRIVVWTVAVGVFAVVVGWASLRLLAPDEAAVEVAPFVLVEATEGSVGRSLGVAATASWPATPAANNAAAGTVTSVDLDRGSPTGAGDRLFSVDLRPVVAAVGDVPSFRSLGEGASGADVEQLQRLLTELDFYAGSVDGRFESGTAAAVTRWQQSLELAADGVVRPGDVMYFPALPRLVLLDEQLVSRGARLSGGEPVASVVAQAPSFRIAATAAQDQQIADDTPIEITSPEGAVWNALVERRTSEAEGTTLVLRGLDDGSLCGGDCGQVPLTGDTSLPARAVVVPETAGVVVPSSAIVFRADGSEAVVLESGQERAVSVEVEALGLSVVSGLDAGEVVRSSSQAAR